VPLNLFELVFVWSGNLELFLRKYSFCKKISQEKNAEKTKGAPKKGESREVYFQGNSISAQKEFVKRISLFLSICKIQ
jgi:hypothetical protein